MKKLLCYIFVLALCFNIIACSKTGGSGTTAHAQSNTQADNSGVIVTQSSSSNTQSQSRVIEEKYQGEYLNPGHPLIGELLIGFYDVGIYIEGYDGSQYDGIDVAWTAGNELWVEGNSILGRPDYKLGTFIDINTFVIEAENTSLYQMLLMFETGNFTFKRK
jgi:hypothetical protein